MPMNHETQAIPPIDDLLASPEISFWLKDAIRANLKRDPVDALNDAELLANVMKRRLEQLS